MPRIFDNIEQELLPALQETLKVANRADFCVGFFNLRGWRQIDSYIDNWAGGEDKCCRLLVGMTKLPQEELREAFTLIKRNDGIDNTTAQQLRKRLAQEFRDQLTFGVPTNEDEAGLRRLASQIKTQKVIVKLFVKHSLHAKLYLLFRPDPINPSVAFLGSSNLTFAGLSQQGELNIDVLDHDACGKLARWFEDRWNDRWCIDISKELAQIIDESWAREEPISPYYIYLKMAYHLSQEARAGLSEFQIPREFGQKLFDFQTAAVKIAAHHINKRGGVLLGDVVGLGKTLMATAVARIFEDDYGLETLILCPKNLVSMWEDYREQYRMHARVLSITRASRELSTLRRYRLVIIDESQNLRNREGKRYRAIQEYLQENESKVILLSATPYNKTYLDLSNQIRLFVPADKDIGIRPENKLREIGETEFIRQHQCLIRSLAAFEKSEYADDWRELMRLYLVRRTRSFIQENYAATDPQNSRKYLTFEDGTRSYFPTRTPKTIKFNIADGDQDDQYTLLFTPDVVDAINHLNLPRYGLGNYLAATPHKPPTATEQIIIQDLSRAGRRLMGFCRTNLFKRLESCGYAFLQSIERHILRNYIFLHAIENELPLPIGAQDIAALDSRVFDEDADTIFETGDMFEDDDENIPINNQPSLMREEKEFRGKAKEIYGEYQNQYQRRFKWLASPLFVKSLTNDLRGDIDALTKILHKCKRWQPEKDAKLNELFTLLTKKHREEKVLVFSQFADTVRYLEDQLKARGVSKLAGVTGDLDNPTAFAWRFSPVSNNKRERISRDEELRILIATDVLSEGQNLQDCSIVVNFDLPWAIIRLIQRVGRVDRIGQHSENISCYSFLPAEGVERIINLRNRVRRRLQENAEVVGSDESFFEDDKDNQKVLDLYNEKAGILDGDIDGEVDLASYAYQIWKNAITQHPELQKLIPELPPVVYSARQYSTTEKEPEGVLVYLQTSEGNDALAWIDKQGKSVTESQYAILKAAECPPALPALPKLVQHHQLVQKGVEHIIEEEKSIGGQLGRPSGARFRTYERLKRYVEEVRGTLFESPELLKAIDDIYRYPLRQAAVDTLNRQLRSGISDQTLAELVTALREEGKFCVISEDEFVHEPRIICSLGLISKESG